MAGRTFSGFVPASRTAIAHCSTLETPSAACSALIFSTIFRAFSRSSAEIWLWSVCTSLVAGPRNVITISGLTRCLSPYYQKGTARAIDAHTVEIPLKIPFAPDFIPTLALDFCKIVAKHWGESGTDVQKWENAIGSGPFKPGKFVKDVSIELVKPAARQFAKRT